MSILDTLRKTAKLVGSVGVEILKKTPLPVSLNTDVLNTALANALPAGLIERLLVTSNDGYFEVALQVIHRTGTYRVEAAFEIVNIKLGRNEQRVTLKPTTPVTLHGTSLRSRWNAFLYKLVMKMMPIIDPIRTELAKVPGFYFSSDQWTIDLNELGFRAVVEKLVSEKLCEASSSLGALGASATNLIFNNVVIEELKPQKNKFILYIRYVG